MILCWSQLDWWKSPAGVSSSAAPGITGREGEGKVASGHTSWWLRLKTSTKGL